MGPLRCHRKLPTAFSRDSASFQVDLFRMQWDSYAICLLSTLSSTTRSCPNLQNKRGTVTKNSPRPRLQFSKQPHPLRIQQLRTPSLSVHNCRSPSPSPSLPPPKHRMTEINPRNASTRPSGLARAARSVQTPPNSNAARTRSSPTTMSNMSQKRYLRSWDTARQDTLRTSTGLSVALMSASESAWTTPHASATAVPEPVQQEHRYSSVPSGSKLVTPDPDCSSFKAVSSYSPKVQRPTCRHSPGKKPLLSMQKTRGEPQRPPHPIHAHPSENLPVLHPSQRKRSHAMASPPEHLPVEALLPSPKRFRAGSVAPTDQMQHFPIVPRTAARDTVHACPSMEPAHPASQPVTMTEPMPDLSLQPAFSRSSQATPPPAQPPVSPARAQQPANANHVWHMRTFGGANRTAADVGIQECAPEQHQPQPLQRRSLQPCDSSPSASANQPAAIQHRPELYLPLPETQVDLLQEAHIPLPESPVTLLEIDIASLESAGNGPELLAAHPSHPPREVTSIPAECSPQNWTSREDVIQAGGREYPCW